MNGAEDASEQSRIPWALLKLDKIDIQAREVLITFDQEFPNSLLIFCTYVVYDPLLVPRCRGALDHGALK